MPRKRKSIKKQSGFYGTTTLGERGQVVIPAKMREEFKLEKGEQLLVFGMGENMITLVKLEGARAFVRRVSGKLKSIESVLVKSIKE